MICARIQGHGHLTNATTWKATDHFITFYFKLQMKYSIKLAYRDCQYRMICYPFHQPQPCKPPNAQAYAPFIRYKTTVFANFCILNPFLKKRSQMKQQQNNLGLKKDTFDDNKQIEDAIACITSTAEQMASFTFWISACSNKRTKLKFILPQMCQFLGSGDVNAYLCPTNNRKAKSASPQSFSSP